MRHRFKRLFADTVFRMRTVGASPRKQALALAVGVFIGCTPFFGLHLAICLVTARLLQLSPVTMYAGAQVSYPLFAPFVYFVEIRIGAWLRRGEALDVSLAMLRDMGHSELVSYMLTALGDWMLGSLVLGLALGGLFGVIGYQLFARAAGEPERERVAGEVSRRYLEASIFDWEYVRAKVKSDPVYLAILHRRLLPDGGRLVDLGCGRGLLLALIGEAEVLWTAGGWPEGWPAPPLGMELLGAELSPKKCRVARLGLGERAHIAEADLATFAIPDADALALIDVLHYLPAREQERVIERAAAALRPGGVLLLRETDTEPRWRFVISKFGERAAAILRGAFRQRFHFRSAAEWTALMTAAGLEVEVFPASERTPFSNLLFSAKKR